VRLLDARHPPAATLMLEVLRSATETDLRENP
jgi:hypothetical protein